MIHNNHQGIVASYADLENNRVYNHSSLGVSLSRSGGIRGYVNYSNAAGIVAQAFVGQLINNVVYANATNGMLLTPAFDGTKVLNNTIVQPQGTAIQVLDDSRQVVVRNNIVSIGTGQAIVVAADSQVGFSSDYNLVQIDGPGSFGIWQNATRSKLSAWRSASLQDQNSIVTNPLFVDRDGGDDVLGYRDVLADGRDDDFHVQSLVGSFHSRSLAPVIDMLTQHAAWLVPSPTPDAAHPPAIDRGDAADRFDNEPLPNGGFINLGTFGNTVHASRSFETYLTVLQPNGGETAPAESDVCGPLAKSQYAGLCPHRATKRKCRYRTGRHHFSKCAQHGRVPLAGSCRPHTSFTLRHSRSPPGRRTHFRRERRDVYDFSGDPDLLCE